MKSLHEQWKQFASMVFRGINPSKTQVEEMQKSFYAGAFVVLCDIDQIASDSVSEDEGMNHLIDIRSECEEFAKSVELDIRGKR